MRAGASDTDSETERRHLELLRRATPGRRIRLALSLSRSVMSLSRDGLSRRLADPSPEAVGLRFVALHYGAAARRRGARRTRLSQAMSDPELLVALSPVLQALRDLNVRHFVGGSLASSAR